MPETKGQKRLPGYLILFMQEQAKEFYSCTKPILAELSQSSNHLSHIYMVSLVWPIILMENQVSNASSWIPWIYMLFFTLDFSSLSSTLLYLLTWQHSVLPKWSMFFLKRHTDWQHNHEQWWWSQLPQDCPILFWASWHRRSKDCSVAD